MTCFLFRYFPIPSVLLTFTLLSLLMCIPLLTFSALNFGLLCIWFNAGSAFGALTFYSTLLILICRRRIPGIIPSASLTRSESNSKGASASRLRPLVITSTLPSPKASSVAYSGISLMILTFLWTLNTLALVITLDVSIGGAKSILPSERAKGMTRPWNINVQITQCSLLGVQTLLMGVVLALCSIGRSRIREEENGQREMMEYGFEPSVSRSGSVKSWTSNKALELA